MSTSGSTLSVASKVPFSELAGLLERIERLSGRRTLETRRSILKEFVVKWRSFHDKLHADNPNTADSFFPALRLLLPQLEKERVAYGIKENTLARLFIEVLCLNKESPDAQKLLNYKAPKVAKGAGGDFASVAYFVLKNRCPDKGKLTIEDVNECLNGIASGNAKKNKDAVRKHILKLLKESSALEQKWLIRMIMKELKCGISQQTVFSVYHEDAEDLYNVTNSLEKVAVQLKNPAVRLHEIGISMFSPFRPMLGERGAPSKVEKLMDNKEFYVETKYDGERMQLHKDDAIYKYFSRGGNEYTATYGSSPYDGNFTPYVHSAFLPNVKACILDGEMLGYNAETKTLGSKGENFDIKSKDIKDYQPCLAIFDILYLNGEVLSNKPLSERTDILKEVINPIEGRIFLSERKIAKTRQDCADALNEAIDNREEGIMIKSINSIYKPNTRRGGWFKIKPEYVGGLMDELDLVVVGGYFGGGHRSGMMSHFLLAAAIPPAAGQSKPTVFHSFCKVGTGYTRRELYEFNRSLANHLQVFDKKNPPTSIILASGFKEKPDLWIEPSKSYILQVKAAEVIDSERFKTKCTLRFPRVEKIRSDKKWYDCMTTDDIEQLRKKSEGKLAAHYAGIEEEEPSKKKRRVIQRSAKPTVAVQFRATDTSTVLQVSEMFAGKEFCIVNGSTAHTKADLEKAVVKFGGEIVQNPDVKSTYCIVAEKVVVKVNNFIKTGCYDVVKASWLARCDGAKRFIPWTPLDMIFTSAKTKAQFALDYDKYGDSFFDDTSAEQLEIVFKEISEQDNTEKVNSEMIASFEMEYFPNESEFGLFRLCRVYLDNNLVIGDSTTHIKDSSLDLLGLEIRSYGATVVDSIDEKVSHVVVDSGDTERVHELRNLSKSREKMFHLVTERWAYDCLESKSLKTERYYGP